MIYITKDEINHILENHPYFEVLSEFNGLRKPILRKCKICGDIREVNARCLVEKDINNNYRKCAICSAKERAKLKRKTHEQFIKEMQNINPNIEFLSEYITNDTNITCHCLIDDNIWETKPHILLGNHGCPVCADKFQNRRSHKEYIEEMKIKHPNIIPLDEFKGVNTKMHFKCTVCDYEWYAVSNALLNKSNSGCPKCSNHAKVSEQEIINRMASNEYVEYIDGYIDTLHHANFKCKICGYEWHTLPLSVIKGRCCPKCNISQGEKRISDVLDSLNIHYETEYSFDDCKDIRNLRFDFYLPNYNTCVEYDGEQHFKPVRFDKHNSRGTPQERFEKTKYRDELKNDYCKNNNITLIRIPYTDFDNIESILNKHFS